MGRRGARAQGAAAPLSAEALGAAAPGVGSTVLLRDRRDASMAANERRPPPLRIDDARRLGAAMRPASLFTLPKPCTDGKDDRRRLGPCRGPVPLLPPCIVNIAAGDFECASGSSIRNVAARVRRPFPALRVVRA